jgi:hypothetical protein
VKIEDAIQKVSGHFYMEVRNGAGDLVEVMDEPNLVVIGSRQSLARLLGGDVADRSVTRIGYGTSTAVAAVGNTALTNQFAKLLDSVSYPATDQVRFNFSLTSAENNGVAIGEFGLLTAAGVLFARKNRTTPLNKESDLSFSGSWTITFL